MKMMKRLIPVILILILMPVHVYADDEADFQDGLDAYEKNDYKTAIEKFKPLAKQGYAKAQYYLSGMYRSGLGVGQTIYPKKDKLNIRNHVSSWGTANNMCNLNIWMLKTV